MSGIKRAVLRVLLHPLPLRGIERSARGTAAVLTLHRFSWHDRPGHDPARLADNLEWLRKRRYHVLPLRRAVEAALRGEALPPRAVVFTVDDGYADFAEIAAPVFARFDCPVTVFLITGFLDGGTWLWWDRVRFALEQTGRSSARFAWRGVEQSVSWHNPQERRQAARALIATLKGLPTRDRVEAQAALESQLEVALPAVPPPDLGPLSWDQVRQLEARGVTFGPHSVTHPILALSDDAQARFEIEESWRRLRTEVKEPVPIFCWPNGNATSFGPRESLVAQAAGLVAGLSTVPGSVGGGAAAAPFGLPRYPYPDDPMDFAQAASGLERLKAMIRG